MARARNIKPGFFKNEELVELSFGTRLLFIGLWTEADRAGRMEDKPKRIKMNLFPADDIDIDAGLNDLQARGFIARYESGGARYIQIIAFGKHQNPHKDEKASTLPAPCEPGTSPVQAPNSEGGNPADSLPLIPDPLNLIPDPLTTAGGNSAADVRGVPGFTPTPAGAICKALRQAGIADTNPGHPDLIVLLEVGATEAEFLGAVPAALGKGRAFAYVLGTVKRQRTDAAKTAQGLHVGPMPRASPGRKDRQLEMAGLMTGAIRSAPQPRMDTVDVESKLIPS